MSRKVVFVHGINSNGDDTFALMRDVLLSDSASGASSRWAEDDLIIYRYDFNKPIRDNGRRLSEFLRQHVGSDEIALVCHSMGGLVGRIAILEGGIPAVRLLIMIATPNFGSIQDGQIGLLMQPFMKIGRAFLAWRPRKEGLRDLTIAPQIFNQIFQTGADRTDVDYVTIPGTFFHQLRSVWDRPDKELISAFFTALNVSAEIAKALFPLFAVNMPRPHDGIVTERSNAFVPVLAGYEAEKNQSINAPTGDPTYAHVRPRASNELHHCNITHDTRIIALIRSILETQSLKEWLRSRSPSDYATLNISTKTFS